MIVFDLRCTHDHRFEGWFASGGDCEAQLAAGDVACPECGDTTVAKALSAPSINGGTTAPDTAPCGLPTCATGGCQMMGGG